MVKKRINFDIDEDTHRRARIKAAQEGRSLADIIRDLLLKWLNNKNNK